MSERSTPQLVVYETGGGCRLSLAGQVSGSGRTLQDAADDLVARLLRLAAAFHGSGLSIPSEASGAERPFLEYVWQLGELAARGEDVRAHVLGPEIGRS